ncbi:MAG: hypothetical protein PHH47_11860 [Gallionella sp.]|nr:hypothetical protein [Gallionella sp.]MDD4946426.1 hypothetical protein [Gallionella sp.]
MDFISWSVFGILFILAQFSIRTPYLTAIGLAFIYPAVADFLHASMVTQVIALVVGVTIHCFIAYLLGKGKSAPQSGNSRSDVGQRVEVIEWLDEGTARVMYEGREWVADKAMSEMPDADHGTIKTVQYGRLIITTERNS